MKTNAIFWLRFSYWAGALLDLAAGLMMVFPSLFAFMNKPAVFQPGLDYRFAMGMGAPLMFGWAVLLLWADRKPLERKGILPITLMVIAGDVTTQVWGLATGFLSLQPLLPTFAIQLVLVALFTFSDWNTGKVK